MKVTYNSEELISSEEKCFLIQNKEHMKFCQIFLLYLQIFLQTRFAGLRRNLDSAYNHCILQPTTLTNLKISNLLGHFTHSVQHWAREHLREDGNAPVDRNWETDNMFQPERRHSYKIFTSLSLHQLLIFHIFFALLNVGILSTYFFSVKKARICQISLIYWTFFTTDVINWSLKLSIFITKSAKCTKFF